MNGLSRRRWGVPNRSKARRWAASGATASRRRTPLDIKRPVVLLWIRSMLAGVITSSWSLAGGGVLHQARVRAAQPLLGRGNAQQPGRAGDGERNGGNVAS